MTTLDELRRIITEVLSEDEEMEDSGDSYKPSPQSSDQDSEENEERSGRQRKKAKRGPEILAVPGTSKSAVLPSEQRALASTSTTASHEATSTDEVGLPTNLVAEEVIVEQVTITGTKPPPVKRKKRDLSSWKSHKRFVSHQRGESYTSRRGVEVPAKQVQNFKDCVHGCKFKCGVSISQDERQALFKAYYEMDQNGKYHYILNTTMKSQTERPKDKNRDSYKKFTFRYFFNVGSQKIQVCKKFFLGTLNISQKPVYNVHKNKDILTNTPKPDGRGKSAHSSRSLDEKTKDSVRNHIKSFPTIESHYCRATTKRKYLDPSLNLVKMYKLYSEMCKEQNVLPVKLSMYRNIFVTEFNLDFHIRKSDRCDLCEENRVASTQNIITDEMKLKYEKHVDEKNAMRENRKKDRENKSVAVLCFDLQNVIACPRAEISSFFYKRKLNTYNMTAHFSSSKTIYCALWTEATAGRTGNDLASAVYKILNQVALEHEFTELILWSDSCVPQNRNSFISCAVLNFIHDNPTIKKITMKYSVPGHSCIQEVDNAHSLIEKGMAHNEFYSPLGLIRILKGLNRQNPIRVLQMRNSDFLDFGSSSKALNFQLVPFFKVSVLIFTQSLHLVTFKTSFLQENEVNVNLRFTSATKKCRKTEKSKKREKESSIPIWRLIKPKELLNSKVALPEEKVKDIKSMFKFMPLQDREFYSTVLKL